MYRLILAQPITGLQAGSASIKPAMRSQNSRMVAVLAVTRTEQLRNGLRTKPLVPDPCDALAVSCIAICWDTWETYSQRLRCVDTGCTKDVALCQQSGQYIVIAGAIESS